jgi:hypothetical protein
VLHDIIEDPDTTRAELEAGFGADIAALVTDVTDDTSLPKAARKQLQVDRAANKSARAKLIKLADKTSNLTRPVVEPTRRLAALAQARALSLGAGGCGGLPRHQSRARKRCWTAPSTPGSRRWAERSPAAFAGIEALVCCALPFPDGGIP